MTDHPRIVGILHVVAGLLLAMASAVVLAFAPGFAEGSHKTVPLLFMGLPLLFLGGIEAWAGRCFASDRERGSARAVLWAFCVIWGFVFPIGTALAVYSVWALWITRPLREGALRIAVPLLCGLVVPFVISYVAVVGSLVTAARRSPDVARLQTDSHEQMAAFLEDQRRLTEAGLFPDRPRSRDVGPFLTRRIAWIGAEGPEPPGPYGDEVLRPVPLDVYDAVTAAVDDWPSLEDQLDLQDVDVRWMAALQGFDHWNLHAGHEPESVGDYIAAPLPSFVDLWVRVRLRLLHAIHYQRLDSALPEVRHLAELAHSTATLAGVAWALQLLEDERIAVAAWTARHPDEPLGWTLVSEEMIQRGRRVLRAQAGYFSLYVDPDDIRQAFAEPDQRFARCAAVHERLFLAAAFRPLLGSHHADQYAALDEVIAAEVSRCGLDFALPIWERGQRPLAEVPASDHAWFLGDTVGPWRLPGVRSALARFLSALAVADDFRDYRGES